MYGLDRAVTDLEAQAVSVAEAPERGSTVLRGEVGQVCTQGCWFYLMDPTSMLYVELDLGTGLIIPRDSLGKEALVAGELVGEGPERRLDGATVALR